MRASSSVKIKINKTLCSCVLGWCRETGSETQDMNCSALCCRERQRKLDRQTVTDREQSSQGSWRMNRQTWAIYLLYSSCLTSAACQSEPREHECCRAGEEKVGEEKKKNAWSCLMGMWVGWRDGERLSERERKIDRLREGQWERTIERNRKREQWKWNDIVNEKRESKKITESLEGEERSKDGRDERGYVSRAVNLIKDFFFQQTDVEHFWWLRGEEEWSEGEWAGGPERLKKER